MNALLAGLVAGFMQYSAEPLVGNTALSPVLVEIERVDWLATGPAPERRVPVGYPKDASVRHIAGCVVVSLEVTGKGEADRFVVLNSQPAGVFDRAALDSLMHWRYPASAAGKRDVQMFKFGFDQQATGTRVAGPPPPECDVPAARVTSVAAQDPGVRLASHGIPAYPPAAAKAGQKGCAAIAFDLGADGVPSKFVGVTSPDGELERALAASVRGWKFEPPAKPTRVAVVARYDIADADDGPGEARCPGIKGFPAPVAGF